MVEDIVQTLAEYRRSGTMPDDTVFGWRDRKRPANAVDRHFPLFYPEDRLKPLQPHQSLDPTAARPRRGDCASG